LGQRIRARTLRFVVACPDARYAGLERLSAHDQIPAGHRPARRQIAVRSVHLREDRPRNHGVRVRHRRWPDAAQIQPADHKFPGATLEALKLLHLERKILLHGHEPLDADSTQTLVAEDWLMNNGYMQAEGVTNLDQVPSTGALIAIGFPRLKGGTGGFASFTAICPPVWTHGARPGEVAEAPLPYNEKRLVWNEAKGVRERSAACDKPKGKQSFN